MEKHKLLLEKIINYKETADESMTWREYIDGMDNLIDEAIEELQKENTTSTYE